MIGNSIEIPCVFVCVSGSKEVLLREILAGIEEEGIPSRLINMELDDATMVREVHGAAQQSKIGIAIGVINNRIILHYGKLREDKPLIDIRLNLYEKEKARVIGCNAARLYKIMPLKDIKLVDVELVEKIRTAVASVIDKLNAKVS